MPGFKYLKISHFAYWPTRKPAYFRYTSGPAEAEAFFKEKTWASEEV